MSLDLSNKKGAATTDFANPETTTLATLADADFTTGDLEEAGFLQVFVNTDAGNITLAPSNSLTFLEDGDEMTIVKVGDPNRMIFTDPVTGYVARHANRNGESYTLKLIAGVWRFKH